MKEKGWRPFWAALLAALLVLLPLVGGTVLLTRRSLRTRLASRPQSGVAIRQPKEENRLSLLVCIAPTETTAPGFLLLYLNASQNCIHALALPGELTVPFGADETALSDCYRAAGPARCREALLSALSLPEDTHYLALAPSVLQAIADRYGMLRRTIEVISEAIPIRLDSIELLNSIPRCTKSFIAPTALYAPTSARTRFVAEEIAESN